VPFAEIVGDYCLVADLLRRGFLGGAVSGANESAI
jgi:hypothetical protein